MRNRWLYRNRIFGRYLLDYQQGRGIPSGVKTSALITMWSSMMFTAIVLHRPLVDQDSAVPVVSLFVTIHILRT